MKKHTALIAAAALALSAGLASAQTQTPRNYDSSGAPQTSGQRSGGGMSGGAATGSSGNSGMTGAPSSTNPQAGGGPGGPRRIRFRRMAGRQMRPPQAATRANTTR